MTGSARIPMPLVPSSGIERGQTSSGERPRRRTTRRRTTRPSRPAGRRASRAMAAFHSRRLTKRPLRVPTSQKRQRANTPPSTSEASNRVSSPNRCGTRCQVSGRGCQPTPSNRLDNPTVTTDTTRPVVASGAPTTTGRFFDSRGQLVGTDGGTEDRRYLVNDAGAEFLKQHQGVGTVADIRTAGGAVYEIRGTYASYEWIDSTFARRSPDRGESHAALTISATGTDVITNFGTVTAGRNDGYNVGRTYTQSDFVRIGNRSEAGDGAEVVFVAHDHPRDKSQPERYQNALMDNPTGYMVGQNSEPPNDYSAIGDIDRMARSVAVRGSERVYGVPLQ